MAQPPLSAAIPTVPSTNATGGGVWMPATSSPITATASAPAPMAMRRVDQPRQAALADGGEVRYRDREQVQHLCDQLAVEISATQHDAAIRRDMLD